VAAAREVGRVAEQAMAAQREEWTAEMWAVVAAAAEAKMEGWTGGWAVGWKEGWWAAVQVVVRMEE